MSDKKDEKPNNTPPEPIRAILEAAQAAVSTPAQICRNVEDHFDSEIRNGCRKNKFIEQSAGNCSKRCEGVLEPKIVPCFHLRWGDGPQDHLETDDTEVLCITVCNPYFNTTLKDFTLQLFVIPPGGGAIPNQPDGTPSVMIKPSFNICFGDIEPCKLELFNEKSCVSREVVLINRGAIPGKYRVALFYCFESCFTKAAFEPEGFVLDLVAS